MMKLNQTFSGVKQINALALAYMGDAVLDTYVRYRLIAAGKVRPNRLHKEATRYVSAKAQAVVIRQLLDEDVLTDAEVAVVKRGRNAKSGSVPKNTDINTYRYSTAFEALLGFYYLGDQYERMDEIMEMMFTIIEDSSERGEDGGE